MSLRGRYVYYILQYDDFHSIRTQFACLRSLAESPNYLMERICYIVQFMQIHRFGFFFPHAPGCLLGGSHRCRQCRRTFPLCPCTITGRLYAYAISHSYGAHAHTHTQATLTQTYKLCSKSDYRFSAMFSVIHLHP